MIVEPSDSWKSALQRIGKLVTAALTCNLLTGVARPDGDMFFEAQEVVGQPEYVMFGNIKDDRGEYLEGALVTIKVGEPMLAYTQPTDILGHYRTLDIGRAIKDLGYEVHPSQVTLSVVCPGYHVVQRMNRGRSNQNRGAVEVNFVMAKDSS